MDFIAKIKQKSKTRDIAVWGIDDIALKCFYVLSFNGITPLLISDRYKETPVIKGIKVHKKKDLLNKERLYVIIVANSNYCVKVLKEAGFTNDDYVVKTDGFLKYDCLWDGVFIGKYTTTGNAFRNCLGIHSQHNYISSIGRCCSFNGLAYMNGNHNIAKISINQYFLKYVDSITNHNEIKELNKYLEPYNDLSISNDVWIGANSFINVSKVKHIGNGAVIGAGAIVNEDVPPYAIVLGVPGKIKRYRFNEKQIEILERVKWWDWNEEMIKENADCFRDINIFFEKYN